MGRTLIIARRGVARPPALAAFAVYLAAALVLFGRPFLHGAALLPSRFVLTD